MFGLSTRNRQHAKLWLGIACSALFLILVFHNVRWLELAAVLKTVDWAILLLAAVFYALSLQVRGLCWQALLAHLGPVTTVDAISHANIGYMANSLLPLRAGEVIRAAMLASKRSLSKSAVLGTIVLERLLDIFILGALATVLMLALPIPPILKQSILLTVVVGCFGIVGIWAAGRYCSSLSVERLGGWRDRRAVRVLVNLLQSFARGLSGVRSPKQIGVAILYSLLAWMLACGSIYLMISACQLHLPWYAALLVLAVVNLGSAIPSSPGSIGVVHFMAMVGVSPWAVNHEVAVGFAIVFQALSFTVTVGMGGAWLLKEKLGVVGVNKASLEAAQ